MKYFLLFIAAHLTTILFAQNLTWPHGTESINYFGAPQPPTVTSCINRGVFDGLFDFSEASDEQPIIDIIDCPTTSYTTIGNWEKGSYYQGYRTLNGGNFYCNPTADGGSEYWGSHPLIRNTVENLLFHIHGRAYLTCADDRATSLDKIKEAVDYLLDQQITYGNLIPNFYGTYYWWNTRPSKTKGTIYSHVKAADLPPNSNSTGTVYESGYALRGLSEAYMYFKEQGTSYRETEILAAIEKVADYFADDSRSILSAWGTRVNYQAIGIWGLTAAYKITQNCTYYDQIHRTVCNIMTKQIKTNDEYVKDQNGVDIKKDVETQTDRKILNMAGYFIQPSDVRNHTKKVEDLTSNSSYEVYHDMRINYHLIILRGLISAIDVIPKYDAIYSDLISSIKTGSNVVMANHMNASGCGNLKQVHIDVTGATIPAGAIGNCGNYIGFAGEAFGMLQYYSTKIVSQFTTSEADAVKQATNYIANHSSLSTSYEKRKLFGVAAILHYQDASDSNPFYINYNFNNRYYDADKISKKVMSVDLEHDGKRDDVVAFYDYGNNLTRIHAWSSIGSEMLYEGDLGKYESPTFNASLVDGKVVSGDFDGDDYWDDIAAFYEYPGGITKLHVWHYDETYNSGEGRYVYKGIKWTNNTIAIQSTEIANLMVSGDFDRDGKNDDIAAFQPLTGSTTKLWVWHFDQTSSAGDLDPAKPLVRYWISGTGQYDAEHMRGRVVSGDFDNDGYHDDIMGIHDLAPNHAIIWEWSPIGGGALGSGGSAHKFWEGTSWDADRVIGRVTSGDFDRDGYWDDIAGFDNHGGTNTTTIWVWRSHGCLSCDEGNLNGPSDNTGYGAEIWWQSDPGKFSADIVDYRVVGGDFDRDGDNDNIIAIGDYDVTRTIHWFWESAGLGMPFTSAKIWWEADNPLRCSETDASCDPGQTSERRKNPDEIPGLEVTSNTDISIFPNPTSDWIKVNGLHQNSVLVLRDINGRVMLTTTASAENMLIQLSEFTSGLYFLTIQDVENNPVVMKIVKK